MSIKTTLKYSTGVLIMAGALGAPASMIDFDWSGNGSGVISDVSSLDWKPSSSYTIGGIGSQIQDGDELDTYLHGSLGSFLNQNGQAITDDFGLNSNYEVTFVAGFREVVYGINDFVNPVTGELVQSLNFASIDSSVNFFEMYIDYNVNSNPLAGTGYNDGTLIASGIVLPGGGGNIVSNFVFSGDPNNPISIDPNDYNLMDQFGADNWNGVKTNMGMGGSVFETSTDFINDDFMHHDGENLNISFNSSQILPFRQTNPSGQFIDENGNVIDVDLGTINGLTGEGTLLQIDGNSSFDVTPVPVPATIWLFVSALVGMLGIARIKRS